MPTQQLNTSEKRQRQRRRIFEIVLFAMLGALMFCSKILMEALPNIHLLGMLTMAYTLVFRHKALIPIYIYVFLNGLYAGFSLWWMPYLYIWTILWAFTMLLPKRLPVWAAMLIYPALCAAHGFAFGALYAPAEALMHHLSFEQMLAWRASGLWFDVIHGFGNLVAGTLVLPVSKLLTKLLAQRSK